MSSIEMNIAPVINIRRQEIASIDAQLRTLNVSFPGEKRKPKTDQNPEFQAMRSAILEDRRVLSKAQQSDRKFLSRTPSRRPGR